LTDIPVVVLVFEWDFERQTISNATLSTTDDSLSHATNGMEWDAGRRLPLLERKNSPSLSEVE
jgi:hypothetical protein